jgi:hypothetical protein
VATVNTATTRLTALLGQSPKPRAAYAASAAAMTTVTTTGAT